MYTEPLGRLGVLIFLIISCWYLVDFNEINRDKFDLKKYYKGKLVRLWPCYAISITLMAIIVHFFYLPDRMSTWGDWLLNLFFINGFVGTPYVDGAHWYLTTLVAFIMIVGCAKKFGNYLPDYWRKLCFCFEYYHISPCIHCRICKNNQE